MALYTLNTPTPVAVGEAVPFNNVVVKGNCTIKHRNGSGLITLCGGKCCNPTIYKVHFDANVTGVAGSIQLALFVDGERLPDTLMSVVPAAADDVLTVGTDTLVVVDCANASISARVITGATVTVNTASIVVEKEV